jgi:hypothetical protein
MPPPYVLLYAPLPPTPSSVPSPLTLDREAQGKNTHVKCGPEALGASTPLTSLGPTDRKSTPSLPVLTPRPPFSQGYSTSPSNLFSLQTPTALQMPKRSPRPDIL